MNKLLDKYESKGFQILAYPCNQFLRQESGSHEEIQDYVCSTLGYGGKLFEKIDVNGSNTHPTYQWLKQAFPGDITWNFASKFIVNRQGKM